MDGVAIPDVCLFVICAVICVSFCSEDPPKGR